MGTRTSFPAFVRMLGCVSAFLATLPAWAAEAGGVTFQEKVELHGSELVLNGAGVRQRFVFDVYAMGLYLRQKAAEAAAVLSAEGPKRVQIHMLRDVTAEQFTEALVEGVRENSSEAEAKALEPRVQQLAEVMAANKEARKGMRIALDWTGAETRVMVDGKQAGAPISGSDFYRALLRIWLGDRPVQDDLKRRLLGKPA